MVTATLASNRHAELPCNRLKLLDSPITRDWTGATEASRLTTYRDLFRAELDTRAA